MGFYVALLYAGYGAETVVPLFVIGFVIWGWSGLTSDILEGDFQYFTQRENEDGFHYSARNL